MANRRPEMLKKIFKRFASRRDLVTFESLLSDNKKGSAVAFALRRIDEELTRIEEPKSVTLTPARDRSDAMISIPKLI